MYLRGSRVIRFRMYVPIFCNYYGLREWTGPTHLVALPLYAFYFQSINSDCLGYHTSKSSDFLVLFLSGGVLLQ